jgi:hypothetical protein
LAAVPAARVAHSGRDPELGQDHELEQKPDGDDAEHPEEGFHDRFPSCGFHRLSAPRGRTPIVVRRASLRWVGKGRKEEGGRPVRRVDRDTEGKVERWDWANASQAAFTLAADRLRVTLPVDLSEGTHLLCVLSEFDESLRAGGLWQDAGFVQTRLEFVSVRAPQYRRGDVNADGRINIADGVRLLGHLFGGQPAPDCRDAADANDDGALNIADAIRILAHLFASTGPLPAPFEACGADATSDELDCVAYAPCGG